MNSNNHKHITKSQHIIRIIGLGSILLLTLFIGARAEGSGVISGQSCAYCWSEPALSENGRYLAYDDSGGIVKVDLWTGSESLIAYLADDRVDMSADGRYVVFRQYHDYHELGDFNGNVDIYLQDTASGTLACVSSDSVGNVGNGSSHSPSISADGRYSAFSSSSANLVPADSNETGDVFLKDNTTGETMLVSTDSAGAQADAGSDSPSVSDDGQYVAYNSAATNLVRGDSNGTNDIFIKDTQTGATIRVSTDSAGVQGNGSSWYPSISSDGRYVTYYSSATNLIPGDSNGMDDIFIKDTLTGATTRVSTDSGGSQGNGVSRYPSISSDGRYVAFTSNSSNLVSGDTNGQYDEFVKDVLTGNIERVSVNAYGEEANHPDWLGFYIPRISGNGAYVGFASEATNLVPNLSSWNNMYVAASPSCSDTLSTPPDLSLSKVYWASMSEYENGILSVDFTVDSFFDVYYQVDVVGAVNTSVIATNSGVPQYLGDSFLGSSSPLTVKYAVPGGVGIFTTTIYVTALDQCGNAQSLPGVYPGS